MGIKERIIQFVSSKGITIQSFELKCKLSNGAVSKMGDNTRRSTLDKISNTFPELNRTWLLTGEGEMLLSSSASSSNAIPEKMTEVYEVVIKDKDERIRELEAELNQLKGENSILREQMGLGERRASGKSA